MKILFTILHLQPKYEDIFNWNFGQRLHNSRRRFQRRQLWLFLFGRTAPRIICIIWQVQESTNYDRVPELDVKAIFWRLLSALCSCSLFTFFAKPIIICKIWQFHDSTDQESLNLMDFGVVLINHEKKIRTFCIIIFFFKALRGQKYGPISL